MADIESGRQTNRNIKQLQIDRAESLRTQAVNSINESKICQVIGRCGLPLCWVYRQQILHVGYLLTLFTSFCGIFALISLGVSQHATEVGPWSVGRGKIHGSIDVLVSVGLSGANWQSQAGTTLTDNYITWEDPACVVENRNDPYCNDCNSGGNTVAGLVLLATVTRIPSLMLLKARRLAHADEPLIKVLGIFSEGLAAICLAGAMFVWDQYCHLQLPFQPDVHYSYGSGFVLVALGFCTTVGMVVTHLLMLTVDPDESPFHLGPVGEQGKGSQTFESKGKPNPRNQTPASHPNQQSEMDHRKTRSKERHHHRDRGASEERKGERTDKEHKKRREHKHGSGEHKRSKKDRSADPNSNAVAERKTQKSSAI
jgi:hypothetical protein